MPSGKYWQRRPSLFSLLPRCHGLACSQKHTSMVVANPERVVFGHLGSVTPGGRTAKLCRKRTDRFDETIANRLAVWSFWRRTSMM